MSDRDGASGNGPRVPETDGASGAYVLNALNEEERQAFEARMSESEEIRTEVSELNETALLLGRAVEPVTPSAALRASILDLIESTPQLPKLEAEETQAGTNAAAEPGVRPVESSETTREAEILEPTPLARQRWFLRPVVLLVGAAAAVGLLFGGVAIGANQGSDTPSISADGATMSQILSASDVQHTVSDVSTGGKASLYWSDSLGRSALVLDGVTALPSNKTYQLWYINGTHVASAGLVSATSNNVSQVLQGDMKKGDTIGMTVEPSGGSKQPTTKPIVAIQSA